MGVSVCDGEVVAVKLGVPLTVGVWLGLPVSVVEGDVEGVPLGENDGVGV